MVRDLERIVGREFVTPEPSAASLLDASGLLGPFGRADAWVRPGDAAATARVVAWCYAHDVPITPRGGGTGLAGGAVPIEGGVVLGMDRLTRAGAPDPATWSMEVGAGLSTAHVHRLARESGLMFPPDPGAAEQSQIGGNVSTNAGGPHALKYGTTRAWVRALDVVVAPGEVARLGASVNKDSSTLDLARAVVGSEGTLGVVTGAVLRLIPHPARRVGGLMFFGHSQTGTAAVVDLLSSGCEPSALEFLDAGALDAVRRSAPVRVPDEAQFVLLLEFDGDGDEVDAQWADATAVLGEALVIDRLSEHQLADAWRWRQGVPSVVSTMKGGFVSDDILVPVTRLGEIIRRTHEIGASHGLTTCCLGHAGDGNVHSTFMVDPRSAEQVQQAHSAADELLRETIQLGGTISGEHGIGALKVSLLAEQCDSVALRLQAEVKRAFDPKGLLNPGKKLDVRWAQPLRIQPSS